MKRCFGFQCQMDDVKGFVNDKNIYCKDLWIKFE